MQYIVEPIGAHFTDKSIPELATRFDTRYRDGYKLHSVFSVTKPGGCLAGGKPVITYLAIYEKM